LAVLQFDGLTDKKLEELLTESLPVYARIRSWWTLTLMTLRDKHDV
jgi:hypothetical protein